MKRSNGLAALVLTMGLLASSCSLFGDDAASSSMSSNKRSGSQSTIGADNPNHESADSLSWSTCESGTAAAAKLQCAFLEVPLDPDKPTGPTTTIALARLRSTGGSSERVGSLLLNPGGPGGSGIKFLASAVDAFPQKLKDHFDLVSFDPRGVAASDPVRCLNDSAKSKQLEGDLSPDSPAELNRAIEDQKEFLKGCEANSPDMLRYMSTADVATDLDRIRAAVGDEKLTYVGFSYGTAIGAVYATMFPTKTRALVLDGSVSPTSDPIEETRAQALGFEHTLANFVAACNATSDCALAPDASKAINQIRAELDAKPRQVSTSSGTRELGVDLFDIGLATALYDTSLWGTMAEAIRTIDSGGAQLILSLVDRQTGRNPDGTFDNSSDAQSMVSCADQANRLTVKEAEQGAAQIEAAAPIFGQALAWSTLSCLDWPLAAKPVPTITGKGAPPIMVIGTLGDPATPYQWAQQMTQALESAHLLTYEGDGHTAFLRGGPCVDNSVVSYLIDLKLPKDATRCPAAKTQVSFTSLADELVKQMEGLGLSHDLAECVIDGVVNQVGLSEFNRMVLEQDSDALTRAITAQSLSCVSKARN